MPLPPRVHYPAIADVSGGKSLSGDIQTLLVIEIMHFVYVNSWADLDIKITSFEYYKKPQKQTKKHKPLTIYSTTSSAAH